MIDDNCQKSNTETHEEGEFIKSLRDPDQRGVSINQMDAFM